MKQLFVCYVNFTNGVIKTASWIESLIGNLEQNDCIMLLDPNGLKEFKAGDSIYINGREIQYYPANTNNMFSNTCDIIKQEKPDVCLIFGSEFKSSYYALLAAEEAHYLDKTVIFAQGFSSVCAKHYTEGLPNKLLNRRTFRDWLRRDSINKQVQNFKERAIIEDKVLRLTHNMIGRTTLDYTLLMDCNPEAHYYKCNDILRECFYSGCWEYEKCQKHSIFISQYYYPLKGFHYLLEALQIIKRRFPDVCVTAAGYNPVGDDIRTKRITDSSYIAYLRKLSKEYNIEENLRFVGNLSAEEMKEAYLQTNVFVLPSTIENSPNSMAEAMYLGVPSVLANVGGVSDFAVHKKEAFLYPSSASYLLAHYIMEIFSNPEMGIQIGQAGRKRAMTEYHKQRNTKHFLEILDELQQNATD